MKDSAHFGMNKTGIQMSPVMTESMIKGTQEFPPHALDTSADPARLRQEYIRETSQIGTTPLPGSVKGALNAGLQKLTGKHPEVLFDKLGQRLAFERTGVRLYDALITKCEALLPDANLEMLRQFQKEELQHFEMLRDCIETMGGDPTAQTPCADTSGVTAMGILQVISDPRTSIPQSVEALLIAELADNDGWDLLIDLMKDAKQTQMVQKFTHAKVEEESHLLHMRSWLKNLVMKNDSARLQ